MDAVKKKGHSAIFPFSILYREIKDNLASSCDSIFTLIQQRTKRDTDDQSKRACGPWIKDNEMHSKLIALKGWGDAISKTCTKLTLIVTKLPTEENLRSILSELNDQITSFVGSYLHMTECSFGSPLFLTISTTVRGELLQVSDLITILSQGTLANANSATGMVWKTCENVQNIPLSNKAAYRRFIMEKIAIVKDTVREFDEYLSIAKAKIDTMMNNLSIEDQNVTMDDQEDDEDDEMIDGDEEDGYEISDVPFLEESIAFMNFSMEVLKSGLSVMTLVADNNSRSLVHPATENLISQIVSLKENKNDNNTESTSSISMSDINIGIVKNNNIENYNCSQWVAEVCYHSEGIESAITDFGAELYPPLDNEATISAQCKGIELKNKLFFYISLLQNKSILNDKEYLTLTNILLEKFQVIVVKLNKLFIST